jgi:lipopolysaccharide/colanic/teichoic acid biosynthesis glycosyltransferase
MAGTRRTSPSAGSAAATDDRELGAGQAHSLVVVTEVKPAQLVDTPEFDEVLASITSAFYAPAAPRSARTRAAIDRLFDIAVGSLVLVFALPVLAVLMILIRLTSRGPALYTHVRVGRNGELFGCYKLRTMVVDADKQLASLLASRPDLAKEFTETFKLREDPRVTRVGRFLRRTSLDELPQLFNVIRGEMSLVGPRPVTPAETARYGLAVNEVLSVRPGMTGPWQVSGRSDLRSDERAELDLGFVRHHTTRSNVAILVRTARQVVRPHGAY